MKINQERWKEIGTVILSDTVSLKVANANGETALITDVANHGYQPTVVMNHDQARKLAQLLVVSCASQRLAGWYKLLTEHPVCALLGHDLDRRFGDCRRCNTAIDPPAPTLKPGA